MSDASSVMAGGFNPKEPESKKFIEPTIFNAIPHYLPLLIFPLIFLAAIYGGWWLLIPIIFMSVTGAFDKLMGVDGSNIDPMKTSESRLFWHNLPVWVWAFMWPPTLIFGMWQILIVGNLAIWESVVLVIILAMEAQAVFVIGHELIHRRVAWERRLGEFLLASASYPTYATEHVYIHHAKVGTPYDVGSAPKGVSFWKYLPHELISNITNSWAVDRERLARRGLSVWHYSNPFWRYGIGLMFWYLMAFLMGGLWAIPVFAFLGFGCVFSMKLSNYLQHYGLRRVLLPNGRWEKIAPRHSWSADWKFSNWMFFNMQRHADHHATASRHYPLLQVWGPDESPELPGTYADMMNIVLRPKRWFEKMDPLVEQWRQHFYPDMDDWSAYDSPVAMARPDDFAEILNIFSSSPRLAKLIERNPYLLDSLQDREFTDLDLPHGFTGDDGADSLARRGLAKVYWTMEMSTQEIIDRINEIPAADANESVRIVQGWSNDKAFQVCMHVVRGNLTISEARIAFSNLAEASIRVIIDAVVADVVERSGSLKASFAAILQGDIAVREVHMGSDLNLMIVHDGESNQIVSELSDRIQRAMIKLTVDSLLFAKIVDEDSHMPIMRVSDLHAFCWNRPSDAIELLTKSKSIYEYGHSNVSEQIHEVCQQIMADEKLIFALISTLDTAYNKVMEQDKPPLNGLISLAEINAQLDKLNQAANYIQLHDDNRKNNISDQTATDVFVQNELTSLTATANYWRNLKSIVTLVEDDDFDMTTAPISVKDFIDRTAKAENIEISYSSLA